MRSENLKKNSRQFGNEFICISVFVIFFSLLFTFPPYISAFHTYHTTLTRIDYNENEKLAEITIQMFPHDLIPILAKRAKKHIELDRKSNSDTDEIILKYLSENFILKNREGIAKRLVWVGKEVSADTVFIYVEIPLENDFDGFELQNTLFFESFAEQTNLVIARSNNKKSDLLFKVGDKSKAIKLIETSGEKI